MKKTLFNFSFLLLITTFSWNANAQKTVIAQKETLEISKNLTTLQLTPPNLQQLFAEDIVRDRNGELYRIGVSMNTYTTPENSGIWKTLPSGERVWQLKIKSSGAEALSLLFDKFYIYGNTVVTVFNVDGKLLHAPLKSADVQDHGMQNIELCFGDEMILQIKEPRNTKSSIIELTDVMYGYRSTGNSITPKINESDNCQVNVNCSEGAEWKDERNGVARILVKDGNDQGWCTGSLINNTAQDCKPYFLTALHCGVTSSTADFNQWKFYFKYEANACTNPTSQGSLGGASTTLTGCVKKATSNDGGGDSGSDFLLVQIGSAANEATTITKLKSTAIQAYWNGWDANNTVVNKGVGIHHPAGDIKKISTYTSNVATAAWNGNGLSSHWRLTWASTTSGHGVTEGGSSGSPLFNYNNGNSRIIGTLTGGGSYCTNTSAQDYYGKMSYHWDQNTPSGNIKLKTILDPANSGVKILDGSYDPCNGTTNPPTSSYCAATSNNCTYESINNVQLGTINNTTGCTNYGDYTSLSTELVRGQTYTINVIPQAAGTVGNAYTDDEIAVYIDWNNDDAFTGSGERVGYVKIAAGWSSQFTFTVPMTATLATLRMRCRISYQPDEGAISPCGTTADGEVEDYSVKIKNAGSSAGIEENELFNAVQIYPNPVTDQLTIDFKELENGMDLIQIKDITGKTILELKNQDSQLIQVDVSALSKGIYNLVLKTGNIQTTRRFVKN